MALQPAAGARDLNPQQVELNHLIINRLSEVYRLWGYKEVSPPRVERLSTLMAGGAIESNDIVKLVSDEPLGLRPEMTASIARAACTRLAAKDRPLRLWANGTVFVSKEAAEGGLCIEENLQSGVELFGVSEISAEIELLSLLLDAMEVINIKPNSAPTLLIGHTEIMETIISQFNPILQDNIRRCLVNYDLLALEKLEISKDEKSILKKVLLCRGRPSDVLSDLSGIYGETHFSNTFNRLYSMIEPMADSYGIDLQLDPSFQTHFDLYTGIVFQVVCKSDTGPVVIARGGRYDEIVKRIGSIDPNSSGLGFSFAIDKIRDLINMEITKESRGDTLVAYSNNDLLEKAMKRQHDLHKNGIRALLELEACSSQYQAKQLLNPRGCTNLEWIES